MAMDLPTLQKEKKDFNQQFFDDEISQPLVKRNPLDMIAESQEVSFIKKYSGNIVSSLLMWGGGWMLFSSLSMFIYLSDVLPVGSSLLKLLPYLGIGLALLYFGVGEIKKKSDWLLFTIFPLMGCLFGILLKLKPVNLWQDGNFFSGLFVLFFVALLIFYYIKDNFQTSDN